MTTNVPGIKAKHAVISDACRETHGDLEAIEQALEQFCETYCSLLRQWKRGDGAKFHLVLTVEYER